MKLGMIGLGKMGANMAERLRRDGHTVLGMDPAVADADARNLPDLVALLDDRSGAVGGGGADGGDDGVDDGRGGGEGDGAAAPRIAWSMVPSGAPTDAVIDELTGLLSPGDVVVDGGNSNFRDSIRHGEHLAERGIGFVDCGTSGGIWGLDAGYALMVGGADRDVELVAPVLRSLGPGGRFAHVGPVGAGHFTKMVHNGVEYGMMQAYAEGYALLKAAPVEVDVTAAIGSWQEGSVVRSWLLDLLIRALEETPDLAGIASVAADSGEGRWTVHEAVTAGVPVPVISAALYARFSSQHRDEDVAMKVVSALRNQFGGHVIEREAHR